ncbi:MAG: M15 family metallopeptidase [Rothia sp. (in: high G+C Gram-positive bacteria)]|nr:M15 family metallopeptidase [Rothia sp. (in: high G+C Gram-positive bacteria)]
MASSAASSVGMAVFALLLLSGCTSTEVADSHRGHSSSSTPESTVAPSIAATYSASSPDPSPSTPVDIDSASSLTVLVNKTRPLPPITYAPGDLVTVSGVQLRADAAAAAERMFADAAAQGVQMSALSGYRSYEQQVQTYNAWVAAYGQDQADVASARPGYSEHQTGLALDIGTDGSCDLQVCFKDTDAAVWAAQHAQDYGFVLRYPWWHHETTGYWYESWHFRYVGVEEAKALKSSGLETLEEFWGADAAPAYPTQ